MLCYVYHSSINLFYMYGHTNCFMPTVVNCLPSLVYKLPLLVYELPSLVYRLPLLVYEMPSLDRLPSSVYEIILLILVICVTICSTSVHIKDKKEKVSKCLCNCIMCFCEIYKGGYKLCPIVYDDIKQYLIKTCCTKDDLKTSKFKFVEYILESNTTNYENPLHILVHLPLQAHIGIVSLTECHKIAMLHGINVSNLKNKTLAMMKTLFSEHICDNCSTYITVFEILPSKKEHKKIQRKAAKKLKVSKENDILHQKAVHISKKDSTHNLTNLLITEENLAINFPPAPLNKELSHKVITAACKRFEPKQFEEAGCAVCGQLVPLSSLTRLTAVKNHLHVLTAPGITRQERYTISDNPHEHPYAIDHSCKHICNPCRACVRNSRVPKMALAKGLWLGAVPEVLSSLRYVEKMLVARIRHSFCSIRIASGMRKMKAHAIAYQQPMPKIYDILPPPKSDIEEVMAIMFTGPCKPTPCDFKRTPFLVRRNHVKRALDWLILNHADYKDIIISTDNLNEYPEDMPPVSIEYKEMSYNKIPESTSVHDMDNEDGTEEGDCPFTVHGLTGEHLNIMTTNAVKAKALQHLNSQGKFLAISHNEQPESIWHNPQLYPQMFPWLFPYGLGGVGSVNGISDKIHKKWLLMYHDKRFQIDHDFPFIAFSHEQIKTTSSQCFLLAEKKIFSDIQERILNIDNSVLTHLIDRFSKEEFVKPENEEEEKCFQLMKDVDHVAGPVKGSNTSKKWMRNEIWSLIYHRGAPFWYITISPADIKHPLCIYYADKKVEFQEEILPYDERLRLVCSNPVAGARFFDFMIKTFINDILGVGSEHRGIYGDVPAYYGTVEQQGRLTLHLHMLIWLKGNLTPQEMRERILDPNSDWKNHLISWLESCHIGEFITGTQDDILESVSELAKNDSYKNPTETLPQPPPQMCNSTHNSKSECNRCTELHKWWAYFEHTVDDLVSKSNIHNCERGTNKDGSANKTYASCKDNKYGKCKARFPRPIFKSTEINPESGSLNIKKLEKWINFITPSLTYVMRCNTDVTCMWSGTALKAVIMYISDYITKTSLKTHVMFEAIRNVFDKNCDILASSLSEKEKARKLMNKIVNALSTKTEMGGPMVCMYLLENPDHYTNHKFIPFFWYSFVLEVQKAWDTLDPSTHTEKVTLLRSKKRIIGLSPVYDYIYRPSEFKNINLYEWTLQCQRCKYNTKSGKTNDNQEQYLPDIDEIDDERENIEDDGSDETCMEENSESDAETLVDDIISNKLPKNVHRFNKKHPLFDTHIIIHNTLKPNVVINFIGRNLPRCDQGDREFYCVTMLTIFKPWTSGSDLKRDNETWDEAFNNHEFTSREKQIMRNFNIKYECLDAKDDFRAQMKAGATPSEWPLNYMNDNDDIENVSTNVDPYIDLCASNLPDEPNTQNISASEQKRQNDAIEIQNILKRTGWMDKKQKLVSNIELERINPPSQIPAATWKSILQTMKQNVVQNRVIPSPDPHTINYGFTPNIVKIMDKAYLEKRYHTTEHETSINNICKEYSLNDEQERAFRIVANHVVSPMSEPLKMYIGGMGGTGKTQVLKAVSKFFEIRQEAYRFIIVAPTGTAAALLSGSTYHSVFGINDMTGVNQATKIMIQVRTRLQGVDYIFMDEISMLSCHDMYKISAQLCKVMNKPTIPFGGLNFLFAGDFGQLPPPIGSENVSLYSRTVGMFGTKTKSQEEALGRALWHQVTTVVILRQNMRQTQQSEDDDKLRRALNNMRYKDCTVEDIQFLRTLISSPLPGKPSITAPEFRFVSIITAKNAQKDEINRLACQKFAQESEQELVDFFSDDTLKSAEDMNKKSKQQRSKIKITKLTDKLQKILWQLPHSSADKPVPGKLSLCIGLPVMIKCNVATELCITNGQEGIVVGWRSSIGKQNQTILDVLLVKLKSPPKDVQVPGLPLNVVPLTRSTVSITCILPDGSKVSITRSQIEVLPNFAMTDFASQGKTRPYNPVDLNNCRSHQAYYTALSRSSTAKGTVILQGFDTKRITGKASGALRQEFRDLELLDEITQLRYISKLPDSVQGETRNTLIHTFRQYNGLTYVPAAAHPSIRWNDKNPMLDPIADNIPWTIIGKSNKSLTKQDAEYHSLDIPIINLKRKEQPQTKEGHKTKMIKTQPFPNNETSNEYTFHAQSLIPSGTIWHQNSCAYDAILCIVHTIWTSNKNQYTQIFNATNNEILSNLALNFNKHISGLKTLESTRDDMRRFLHQLAPQYFAWGRFTAICPVIRYMFTLPTDTMLYKYMCKNNHITQARTPDNTCLISAGNTIYTSVSEWMSSMIEDTNKTCITCSEQLTLHHEFTFPLPFIALDFTGRIIQLDPTFTIFINNTEASYNLCGIIYFGDAHFTARVICNKNMIWFHDGITTGQKLEYEGLLHNDFQLNDCRNKEAIAAIYIPC